MSLIALIDGDIIVHRIGYTTEEETLPIAKSRLDTMVDSILQSDRFTTGEIYLSDSSDNNYRFSLWPLYKGNRKAQKPVHYEVLKEYLITHWDAKISFGMEADDMLGIRQTEEFMSGKDSAICSIDKDLLQIPGKHFNFVRNEYKIVDYEESLTNFYTQLLTGDVTDNIPGIPGIGPKKAEKILNNADNEKEMLRCCVLAYSKEDAPGLDMLNTFGKLLHIKRTRKEGPEWDLYELMQEFQLEFTPPTQVVPTPSTEPITQA